MSKEHQPYIVAKTEQEFKSLSEKIKELPSTVFEKIEKVQDGLVGIECSYAKEWDTNAKVFIPDTCTQISVFENYIGCYCGDFFIKLPLPDGHYSYIFVKTLNKQQT